MRFLNFCFKAKRLLAIFILLVGILVNGIVSYSQVVNNDIEGRINLELNHSLNSNTINCTVQKDCVDEGLTGRCIKYHNDQWFSFQGSGKGDYYLNISNQHCRDVRGVQVVILKGIPCDVKSYEIIRCHSTGSQNDIFIELNNLDSSQSYLVNIDGYLHDFCSFQIEYSDVPKGLPIEKKFETKGEITRQDDSLTLNWNISHDLSLSMKYFEVWRQRAADSKYMLVKNIPIERNTFGDALLNYKYAAIENLSSSVTYKIVGVSNLKRVLIDDLTFRNGFIVTDKSPEDYIALNLDYKQNTPLTILIFNYDNNALLQNTQLLFKKNKHKKLTYVVSDLKEKGIYNFRIEVINDNTKQRKTLTFFKKVCRSSISSMRTR